MRLEEPIEVELTYSDGSVKHYKKSLGDTISMTGSNDDKPTFLTLLIAPLAIVQKDDI